MAHVIVVGAQIHLVFVKNKSMYSMRLAFLELAYTVVVVSSTYMDLQDRLCCFECLCHCGVSTLFA